jgi:predicted TIM-barrel fold metal-dependent hydrolase
VPEPHVFEQAERLVERYEADVVRLLPPGAELFDAHVHVGQDIDGMVAPLDDLLANFARANIKRAFAFCMDEPDRAPGFRAPNDRTLAAAQASDGVLIPFVRLDLTHEPVEEAIRCLDLGARGIKLHPRSQSFSLTDDRLAPIFALAAERRVPILIHGGRGLPPIADELERLVDGHPGAQLIIAHGGIADLDALSNAFAGRPDVFFDTSVWSPIDLLDVYRRFSPEQALYASDYPYGQQPTALLMALAVGRSAGLTDEQLVGVLGGTANRIAAGEPIPAFSAPSEHRTIEQPISFARIHGYLTMATVLLWTRQPDAIGVLGLALNACHERDGNAEASARIAELLSAARDLWPAVLEAEGDDEKRRLSRATFRLIHLADLEAITGGPWA